MIILHTVMDDASLRLLKDTVFRKVKKSKPQNKKEFFMFCPSSPQMMQKITSCTVPLKWPRNNLYDVTYDNPSHLYIPCL